MLPAYPAMRLQCANGTWQHVSSTLLLSLLVALAGGCGGNAGPERVVVSGTVTYNGEPVSNGSIFFAPVPTCPAPASGTCIVNGQYKADAKGGVPVGTHTIQVEAYRKLTSQPDMDGPTPTRGEPREQYLPERFNVHSRDQITIPSGSRAITKNFELSE
jgi:hypothetical protein